MPDINRPFDTPNINRPLGPDSPSPSTPPTPAPTLPAPQPSPPALPPAPTPIDPQQLAATLYDKFIPAVVSDLVQVGGRIIEGPDYTVINNESVVSFIAAYFIPMNWWQATRTVTKLWFRGKEAWNTTAGVLMSDLYVGVATSSNRQTVRFNTGTLSQAADAWSVAKYGAGAAIAYIPCVTATFENIRIAQFDGFTPFTSVTVQDTAFGTPGDGVPWASALATLARYAGRDPAEFETVDVSGAVGAIILGSAMTDMEVFAGLRKLRPNWTLRTGRKLYIVEKGPLDLDLTIDRDNVLANDDQPITFGGIDASDKPKTLKCNYINSVRDYEPDYVTAGEDSFPVPSTDAFDEDDFNLPIASTPSEMVSQLSFAYYTGEMARKTAEYTGMARYYGIEVGDTQLIVGDRDYYQRVVEVTRKPDFTVDVKTEGFLTCAIAAATDPDIARVVLLMGADGFNGSTTIPDESPAHHGNATIAAGAVISSVQSQFGGSSLRIAGGSDQASWVASSDWALAPSNSSPYTVECWIRPDSVTGSRPIAANNSGLGGHGWVLSTNGTDIVWQWASGGAAAFQSLTTTGVTIAINTWYAVAVDHDASGTIRIYVDGVMRAKTTPANSAQTYAFDPVRLGAGFTGYIDELRITKGAARYASDAGYTPASVKFPRA